MNDEVFAIMAAAGACMALAGLYMRGHKAKARAPAVTPARTPAVPWGWLALRVFLAALTLIVCAAVAGLLLSFLPLAIAAAVVVAARTLNQWRGSGDSHGTARWSERDDLKRAGMLDGKGMPIGRRPPDEGRAAFWQAAWGLLTRSLRESADCCAAMLHALMGRPHGAGELITLKSYVHQLFVCPTGGGKGVSFCIPYLLSLDPARQSAIVFDPKGELITKTGAWLKKRGFKVILIDPFGVAACGTPATPFNPLWTASRGGPDVVDDARACAEDLVERTGKEQDPHWTDSSVAVISAILSFVLRFLPDDECNLNSVREIICDESLYTYAAQALVMAGGVLRQQGLYLLRIRGDGPPTDEFSSIMSSVNRHTSNLSSERLAASLRGGFDPAGLLRPGTAVFFVLPSHQFKAQKNYLRVAISSLIRMIIRRGCGGAECMLLMDEAAMLGVNNDALEQSLQLGRSSGIRLCLFYQSMAQAVAAFPEKYGLILSNCDARFFWAVNDIETAETVSKMLGNSTVIVESADRGETTSRPLAMGDGTGGSHSTNTSRGLSEKERALLDPAEVMSRVPPECVIAFVRGLPPIIARRVFYYSDPLFAGKACDSPAGR